MWNELLVMVLVMRCNIYFIFDFWVSDNIYIFKHAPGQIDPGTFLLCMTNKHSRRVKWLNANKDRNVWCDSRENCILSNKWTTLEISFSKTEIAVADYYINKWKMHEKCEQLYQPMTWFANFTRKETLNWSRKVITTWKGQQNCTTLKSGTPIFRCGQKRWHCETSQKHF